MLLGFDKAFIIVYTLYIKSNIGFLYENSDYKC